MIRSSTRRETRRAAFTMLELLVVLTIIVILVALSTAAAIKFMGSSYTTSTKTTMQRANSRLQQQMAYILDQARQEKIPTLNSDGYPPVKYFDANSMSADNSGNRDRDRARVIHMKFRMQQYFPMTFTEVFSPSCGYPAVQGYLSFLSGYGITSGNAAIQPHESAVCLYMILRYGPNATSEDDLGLNASTKLFGGAPALVDAWGKPLLFCRWPVGDVSTNPPTFVSPVNPSGAQPGFNDPLDPKGRLTVATWLNSNSYNDATYGFAVLCHPLPPRTGTGGPQSVNLTPVIVSSGPDVKMGLSIDPNSGPLSINPPGSKDANDNIFSTYTSN